MGSSGRSKELEYKLNEAFAAVFRDKSGELVLNYLKSITVNRICGPEATDNALRHLEGQRFNFGVIQARYEAGVAQRKMAIDKEKKDV